MGSLLDFAVECQRSGGQREGVEMRGPIKAVNFAFQTTRLRHTPNKRHRYTVEIVDGCYEISLHIPGKIEILQVNWEFPSTSEVLLSRIISSKNKYVSFELRDIRTLEISDYKKVKAVIAGSVFYEEKSES